MLLTAVLCLVACESAPPALEDDGSDPKAKGPAQPTSSHANVPESSPQPPVRGSDEGDDSDHSATASAEDTEQAPLVCPHCRPHPGGQTGDFGTAQAAPCPMPSRPLDAELAQRFRSEDLRTTATRTFSQMLTWGEIEDDGTGLKESWSETTIDGEITIGAFEYRPCLDGVAAPVTIHFSTADGQLDSAAYGEVELLASQREWLADHDPIMVLSAKGDLSTAHGTLDLDPDPNEVQVAELLFNLLIVGDEVHGGLRARLIEYPDEEARLAAEQPTDIPTHGTIYERAAAYFPHDACNGAGRAVAVDASLSELQDASAADLFAQVAGLVGQASPLAAKARDGAATALVIDLGALPEEACVAIPAWGTWSVRLASNASARSEDETLDVTFPVTEISLAPYSSEVDAVQFPNAIGAAKGAMSWPDGMNEPSRGWVATGDGEVELRWP
jgi:hypothetical protein